MDPNEANILEKIEVVHGTDFPEWDWKEVRRRYKIRIKIFHL